MKKALIVGVSSFLPMLASAQSLGNIETLVRSIGRIINLAIPIVFALAILYFFWGLGLYILSAQHDKEDAKKKMLWGIVALFVMSSVWGLIKFLGTAVGVDSTTSAGTVGHLIPSDVPK